jgi:hypothetical protein
MQQSSNFIKKWSNIDSCADEILLEAIINEWKQQHFVCKEEQVGNQVYIFDIGSVNKIQAILNDHGLRIEKMLKNDIPST